MRPRSQCDRIYGFTLVELLVVIAVVAVLAALFIPTGVNHEKSSLVLCGNNLRQIGISEVMWATDNNSNFPSLVSTNQGGTMEYVADGRCDLQYQALAVYLLQPRVLRCPADTREPATNYTALKNANISYFTSLDAGISNFNLFMSGDRNLMINGKMVLPGQAKMTSASTAGWSKDLHYETSKRRIGNIAFPDGHAESVGEESWPQRIASLGTTINRFVFP
jgi:prepilin-type N-terminal cleavage/methylation domain-containing protein/prepilin-type processing-associated H-X9-DG protein